jgi:thioredoxin
MIKRRLFFFSWMSVFSTTIVLSSILLLVFACKKAPGSHESGNNGKTVVQSITNKKEFDAILVSSQHTLVVIDFYADWCGPCRDLEPMFEQIAREWHQNARFYKVNIDRQRTLSMKSGVTGIPYVAFFKKGKKIHSLLGVWPKKSYIQILKRFADPVVDESKNMHSQAI